MKTIGIYNFVFDKQYIWDETNYEIGHIGGSEIWSIEVSNEFIRRGYNVYVFGNPINEHLSENGVHYVKCENFKKTCNDVKFDIIILSRTVECLDDIVGCENIYLMTHDTSIYGDFNAEKMDKIKKIFYQSDFQKEILSKKYMIPDDKFFKTFEGVDTDKYDKYSNVDKGNKMICSINESGLRWFIENVFDSIKKSVPDFVLEIYGNKKDDEYYGFLERDGINFIGDINKEDIIRKRCESKIWVCSDHGYDSNFNFDNGCFSVTAIENAYAKNACILGKWGCFASIFEGYNGFVGGDLYNDFMEPIEYDKLDKFAEELANESIRCLKDDEYRLTLVNSSYEIGKKYTFNNVADDIERAFTMKIEEKLKVILCCIGRLENQYIREFVEYYKNIGFTNICLCDNNRDGEDDFHDAIGDYIDSGFVILKDYRNITEPCQMKAYEECYSEYGEKYDWVAFFDIDEFMFMNKHKNVIEFLSDGIFKDYDMIHLNWLLFGDGDMTYNDGRPLLMRIRKPIDINTTTTYDFPDNFHVKTIIRGGLKDIKFGNPHTPINKLKCCNSYGIECESYSPFTPYDFRNGGLLHFSTKTAEEYANKLKRGFVDISRKGKEKELIEMFFMRNTVTKEKVNLFKDMLGVDVSYLLPYEGDKRSNIKIYSLCFSKKNFKFLDDSVVTPLQVGADNNTNVCKLKDNTGDNISNLNYFYIESTGTYWIWKNIKDVKYKGQMQYRRPLSGVDETMKFDEIFEKYDVITCEPFNHPENSKPTNENEMFIPAKTVEEGYAFSNCLDDLLILEMALKYKFPEYSDDYDKYIKNGENLYYSNGFIMKSEDYDRYCEFLFGCLQGYLDFANIHSEKDLVEHVRYNLETGKYIRYNEQNPLTETGFKWQTEIGGFLSERIWTLWLQHNFSDDRILKLPYIKMEKNMYT